MSNKSIYQDMADETIRIITEKVHIEPEQARKLFLKSQTYRILMQGGEYVDHLMPFDFWDQWKNERLTGNPVFTVDIKNSVLKEEDLD